VNSIWYFLPENLKWLYLKDSIKKTQAMSVSPLPQEVQKDLIKDFEKIHGSNFSNYSLSSLNFSSKCIEI